MELFLAHIFGSGALSGVSSFTLRYHAERIKARYPDDVYNMIRNLFYEDDGTGGRDTIEDARRLKENVTVAMAEGDFELCKFKSNSNEVVDMDPGGGVPRRSR